MSVIRRMRTSGHSLVEASCGLILIYAVGIALVDLAVGIYAMSLNDSACRNAADFAASGNPNEAERRARNVISQSGDGFGKLISPPTLILPIEVNVTSQPVARRDPDSDQLLNPGGTVTGTVRVKTQIEIRPFAIDLLLPQYKVLTFQSSQSFPIHYVMPGELRSK
jgi:hypothetical protein